MMQKGERNHHSHRVGKSLILSIFLEKHLFCNMSPRAHFLKLFLSLNSIPTIIIDDNNNMTSTLSSIHPPDTTISLSHSCVINWLVCVCIVYLSVHFIFLLSLTMHLSRFPNISCHVRFVPNSNAYVFPNRFTSTVLCAIFATSGAHRVSLLLFYIHVCASAHKSD